MNASKIIVFIFFVFLLELGESSAQNIFKFPSSQFRLGWKALGKVKHYSKDNLYVAMDGAAEIFLEFGVDDMFRQTYGNEEAELDVAVFRVSSALGALGIFLSQKGPGETESDWGALNICNQFQVSFVSGNYFVQISNPAADENMLPVMRACASALLKILPHNKMFREKFRKNKNQLNIGERKNNSQNFNTLLFKKLKFLLPRVLPEQNLLEGSERIIFGVFSARGLGLGKLINKFDFASENPALSAKYRCSSGKVCTKIIIFYHNAKTLQTVIKKLKNTIGKYNQNENSWLVALPSAENVKIKISGLMLNIIIE